MPKLPVITPRQLLAVLEKLGFNVIRQKGSHVILRNARGLIATLPMHARDIPKGTLRAILRDAEIGVLELIELL